MPAVSKAQQRFFGFLHSHPAEAKARGISGKVAEEFAHGPSGTTKGLPERVPKSPFGARMHVSNVPKRRLPPPGPPGQAGARMPQSNVAKRSLPPKGPPGRGRQAGAAGDDATNALIGAGIGAMNYGMGDPRTMAMAAKGIGKPQPGSLLQQGIDWGSILATPGQTGTMASLPAGARGGTRGGRPMQLMIGLHNRRKQMGARGHDGDDGMTVLRLFL